MAAVSIAERGASVLGGDERARLAARAGEALGRARTSGNGVLCAITLSAHPETDPTAVALSSRRADEPWLVLEQPERDGAALAGLGCARAIESRGPARFGAVASEWRRVAAAACVDDASSLIAAGGFSFAPNGGSSPAWEGFPPASLHVPEVSLVRRGGEVRLTLATLLAPDDTVEDAVERVERRLADLEARPLPLLDPAPAGRARIVGAMPPEHYEAAVARGVERIRRGELEKVVLAREVEVHAAAPHDAAAVLAVLREAFPGCYVFGVGRGDAAFVAASPELLARREGQRASTVALAGSTRRSADPAVDDHLGEQLLRSAKDREEQAIVARRIQRNLAPRALWLTAPEEPVLVRMANIQHLATPIRAQLAAPIGAVDLAGLLHPTPAVGAEPPGAVGLIPALEGMDRGWYAGAIGWTDAAEDGEFCVGLRCALLRGAVARCYAGDGIVGDSDPAAELAETEIKLQALLPVLAG
jgi:salicylate biosynthesis isochorismate synthase